MFIFGSGYGTFRCYWGARETLQNSNRGEDDPIFMVVDVAMMAADERLAETQALFDEAGKQLLAGLSDEIIRLHNIAEGVRLNAQEAGAGILGALGWSSQ
jgi:hypothetical protein